MRLLPGEIYKPPSRAKRAKTYAARKARRTVRGVVATAKHPVKSLKRFYGVGRYSLALKKTISGTGRMKARGKYGGKALAKAQRRGQMVVGPSPKAQRAVKLQKSLRRAHVIRRVATPIAALALIRAGVEYRRYKKRKAKGGRR